MPQCNATGLSLREGVQDIRLVSGSGRPSHQKKNKRNGPTKGKSRKREKGRGQPSRAWSRKSPRAERPWFPPGTTEQTKKEDEKAKGGDTHGERKGGRRELTAKQTKNGKEVGSQAAEKERALCGALHPVRGGGGAGKREGDKSGGKTKGTTTNGIPKGGITDKGCCGLKNQIVGKKEDGYPHSEARKEGEG